MKKRGIPVIVNHYSKIFDAGVIIISNITTVRNLKQLLQRRKISVLAFLHSISNLEEVMTESPKYTIDILMGRREENYGSFEIDDLEILPDKSILVSIKSSSLPDVHGASFSLSEGIDEILCFV